MIEKVTASVEGSIGVAGNASVTPGSTTVSATVAMPSPASETMSPAPASCRARLWSPRRASTLVILVVSIRRPSRESALTVMLGLTRPDMMRPVTILPSQGSASRIVASMRKLFELSIVGGGT